MPLRSVSLAGRTVRLVVWREVRGQAQEQLVLIRKR